MKLTKKQIEVIKYGNTPLNVSVGATGGGKTHVDILFRIANRIRNIVENKYKGIVIICGYSLETIEDNILSPMRDLWGLKYIPHTPKNATETKLFGKKVRLIGASIEKRTNILRGKNVVYAYCDEIVTYNRNFFIMLLSRMRCTDIKNNLVSKIDCTCNPENARHWFKTDILDKQKINKYVQHFTIYDNPFLPKEFVSNLEAQYEGTVFFDRYILGLWTNAEGLVFINFANNRERWLIDNPETNKYERINIGLDIGGNKSKTILTATGVTFTSSYELHILECRDVRTTGSIDAVKLAEAHYMFYLEICTKYNVKPSQSRVDDNIQLLIKQIRATHNKNASPHNIDFPDKTTIGLKDYIMTINSLFNLDKLKINRTCKAVIESFSTLLYSEKEEDTILDDNSTDVDSYDSSRYSMSDFLINNKKYRWIIGT